MSSIRQRIDAESSVQDQFRNRLEPLVALIERADSLYERSMNAISFHSRPGAAAKVGLILTSRLANDLRVSSLMAQIGYGYQALGSAATVVELVGALSYVGDSDSRAEEWAKHKDLRYTYPRRVADGIEAALTYLGVSDPAARENWHQAYAFMCMAKHANPRILLRHGLRIFPSGAYHVRGPDGTALGTYFSAEALYYLVGFGTLGIRIALGHCSDEALLTQLRTDALSIWRARHDLESWFDDVRHEMQRSESRPDLNREEETLALLSDSQLLQSETERLQRETEHLNRETRRLKKETEKIRNNRMARGSPHTK